MIAMKRPIFIFSVILADLFIVAAAFSAEKAPAEQIARPNLKYKSEGLKDPFQNPLKEVATKPAKGPEASGAEVIKAAPASLTVQGLIWGGELPQAIVNGTVVKVGDTIGGARIISIDKNGVTVLFEEREYRFSPSTIKAKSSKNP